jgi:branched-chain amino acid transport system ATP-binding protein
MEPMLSITGARILYNGAVEAVRDLSMRVEEGSMVALLGRNGAGKSTTLKAISGMLESERGRLVQGDIRFLGTSIRGSRADALVRMGIVQVPEGRRLFAKLTVRENLRIGAHTIPAAAIAAGMDRVLSLFPQLGERLGQRAGYLSGGQQQMVAIGRALMGRPRLLMLDEPSLGLAPLVVAEIFAALAALRAQERLTILLIEQNARLALSAADHAYVLDGGRVVMQGPAAALAADQTIRSVYLGLTGTGERRNLRDGVALPTRPRWPA